MFATTQTKITEEEEERRDRFRSTAKSDKNPFLSRPGTSSNVVKIDREGGMIMADNKRMNDYD